jgi:hypothetical protein
MTGRSRDIQTLLEERLSQIQAISAANSEHMRLNQIASGMMILDQKDEIDGAEPDLRSPERDANAAALERCMTRIETLERGLAQLDRDIEAFRKRDDE